MARIVGIDLGTTNSLVAYMDGDRPRVIPDPETGAALFPSAVSLLPDGTILAGEPARRRAIVHPASSALSVKRFMGVGLEHVDAADRERHRFASEPGALKLVLDSGRADTPGRVLSPPEISAVVLRELRRRAERHLGEEVARAVITVPAYFNDSQRQATRDAGRLAGLDVLRLVNEPTAAALAYGLDQQEEAVIAVYDLGGGTFDVSILRLRGGLFEVLATGGDTHLGGDDFDRRLAEGFAHELELELGDRKTLAILLDAAERVKRDLSASEQASVSIELESGPRVVTTSRGAFEAATSDLVERTIARCRLALKDAGKQPAEIEHVVLVGGATRMPAIRARVAEFFGRAPHVDIDPDQVVALGAAVQAGILSGANRDMLLLDVVPLSLGIETMGGVFSRLIDRNTTIPAAARETFTTAVDDQTHVDVHVLQGERELAKDCRSLARFRIPIAPAPAGLPRLEVTFLIDANGILSVSARDLRTNLEHSIEVKPSYGLTDDEIERLLEESFDQAEEDFSERQLAEARTEAESMLRATERALRDHADVLVEAEGPAIAAAVGELRAACATRDHTRIRDLIDALNTATTPFAQRIMDASIKQALESKPVGEL